MWWWANSTANTDAFDSSGTATKHPEKIRQGKKKYNQYPLKPYNNAKVFFCVIDFTMSRGSFVSLKTSSVSGRFSTAFLSSMDAFPARRRKSESFPRLWIGASYGRTECLLFQSYTPSPKTRTKDQGKLLSSSIFHKQCWMEYTHYDLYEQLISFQYVLVLRGDFSNIQYWLLLRHP